MIDADLDALLSADLSDPLTRLALADCLEEVGSPLDPLMLRGLRQGRSLYPYWVEDEGWYWRPGGGYGVGTLAYLCPRLFDVLPGDGGPYTTDGEAWEDLAAGLRSLLGVAPHSVPDVVNLPSGREVRRTPHGWKVQPWNDNYWLEFERLEDAVQAGTRPVAK